MHNDMQSGQARIIELLGLRNAKLKLEIRRFEDKHNNTLHWYRPVDRTNSQDHLDQLKEEFSDNVWKIFRAKNNLDDGFHYYERYMKTGRF